MSEFHPDAVLKFMKRTTADRLVRNYNTAYGTFIRELFEFVWGTPTINACVRLEGRKNPACITLRYVENRSDAECGVVPRLGKCDQTLELIRWLRFSITHENVEIGRYMTNRAADWPDSGWHRSAFIVHSYAEALADTIYDYTCLKIESLPSASPWQPPPDVGHVPQHILNWRTGSLLE